MERDDARNRSGDGPGLCVAAFGKHPGWNDHIDDLGLETARLVEVKRRMYVEGIAGNIDSGAWDRLPPDQQVDGFSHVFAWRTPADIVVGRMWSSRDGKGRTKYPMVVCAGCTAVPVAWAVEQALPLLEGVQHRCESAPDADTVRAAVDEARAALRARARDHPPKGPELVISDRDLTDLAAAGDMGPGGVGLKRLLYQLEREMSDYFPAHLASTRTRADAARPRHLRAPACRASAPEVLALWMRVLCGQLAPGAQVLVIHPLGRSWVDVVVGAADVPSFYCLRASPRAIALASDVPYDLDPEFLDRIDRRIREGGAAPYRPIGDRGPAAAAGGGVLSRLAFWRSKTALLIIVLVGLAAAAVAFGLLIEGVRSLRVTPKAEVPATAPDARTGASGG